MITNANTTSGDYVVKNSVGVACDFNLKGVVSCIEALLEDNFSSYVRLYDAMPDPETGYMSSDYARSLEAVISATNIEKTVGHDA